MKNIFRIGVLMSSLLIALAGCGSLPWLKGPSGSQEEARVGAKADEAGGQISHAEIRAGAPLPGAEQSHDEGR